MHEVFWAEIFKQSMGARNRLGIGLSYRPARLHSLAEFVPWNQFLGSLKSLKIRALFSRPFPCFLSSQTGEKDFSLIFYITLFARAAFSVCRRRLGVDRNLPGRRAAHPQPLHVSAQRRYLNIKSHEHEIFKLDVLVKKMAYSWMYPKKYHARKGF